ncbi:MAG: AAA family ATPase [Bacteroidota bacterium]
MAELIDAFDYYNDFELHSYFTVVYDSLPSHLVLNLPLKESKQNMDMVMAQIDLVQMGLQPIFKYWSTKDTQNTQIEDDYAHKCFYESDKHKLVIKIALYQEVLEIDFLYDLQDHELERWVLATNHQLRTQFGEQRHQSFKVLTRDDRSFSTEEVKAGNFQDLDLEQHYNDDFALVDKAITRGIEAVSSGLILLHGVPGTGKTSYIKHLIAKFKDRSFIFVQNEFVKELLKPEFITFILRHKDAVLIIEDAERVIMSREFSKEDSVVSTILQLTDGLFSDYLNLKIICTFNSSLEKIDKALLRKGRMIAKYEFKPLTVSKANHLATALGHGEVSEEMSLAEIYKMSEPTFGQEERKKIGFS